MDMNNKHDVKCLACGEFLGQIPNGFTVNELKDWLQKHEIFATGFPAGTLWKENVSIFFCDEHCYNTPIGRFVLATVGYIYRTIGKQEDSIIERPGI
jgi:hypothetical protein